MYLAPSKDDISLVCLSKNRRIKSELLDLDMDRKELISQIRELSLQGRYTDTKLLIEELNRRST